MNGNAFLDSGDETVILNGIVDEGSGTKTKTITIPSGSATASDSNFILLRGSQSENGHIILQSGHELFSLLGGSTDDENNNSNKTFIVQSQKVKPLNSGYPSSNNNNAGSNPSTSNNSNSGFGSSSSSTKIESINNIKNSILFHHNQSHHQQQQSVTIKAGTDPNDSRGNSMTVDGSPAAVAADTILLQTGSNMSGGPKKHVTTLSDGSILVHSGGGGGIGGGNMTRGSPVDGTILLQTLKRLDKSSILVFRNASQGKTILSSYPKSEAGGASSNGHVNLISPTADAGRAKVTVQSDSFPAGGGGSTTSTTAATKGGRGGSNTSGGGGSGGGGGGGINTRASKREAQQKPQSMNVDKDEEVAAVTSVPNSKQSNIPLGTGE